MGISNMTLVKIAAVTGIATITMGYAARANIVNNVRQTGYYKEALKTVRSHKGAVYLLGEPIKDRLINIGDQEKNYTKPLSAHYEIPVKGTKQKGIVYFWAQRKSEEDEWFVSRIELGLNDDLTRRLLIKTDENEKQS